MTTAAVIASAAPNDIIAQRLDSNGVMHWYYSAEPIKNLVRAISRGDATHFAVRYVNVGN